MEDFPALFRMQARAARSWILFLSSPIERLLRANERAMQPLIFARNPGVIGETWIAYDLEIK